MQDVFAGSMFSSTTHILKAYCTKHGSFFIEYLAHSSFKDFARLIVFIEVLIMSFKAPSALCQKCVFSGV